MTIFGDLIKNNFIYNDSINILNILMLKIKPYMWFINIIIENRNLCIFYIILLIISFLVYILYKFGYEIAKELTILFIYQRANFVINSSIFLYIININIKEYIEYNFIFIIILFIVFMHNMSII
jgi:hypothetical protein